MVLPYGSSRKFTPRYSTSHAGDPVVAVAKVLLLCPVAGTVSGVEVEDDLVAGVRIGLGELYHQEGLQGRGVSSILW